MQSIQLGFDQSCLYSSCLGPFILFFFGGGGGVWGVVGGGGRFAFSRGVRTRIYKENH